MKIKNQTIVCVFAHPDDEAFGPGGTIAKLSESNNVYIICVTDGDAGQCDIVEKEKLGDIRKQELLNSAKILGVKEVYFLGYHDGSLCNNLYHEIAEKIKKILADLKPEILLAFEPRGITGHIDHIVMSMVTSFLFYKLPFVQTLYYYCVDEKFRNLVDDYFIHFPPGYKPSEIHMTVDTTEVWETKIKAMKMHHSQNKDLEKTLGWLEKLPKEEYFLVVKK